MGVQSKEIVENFYISLFKDEKGALDNYLHPNVNLSWYGTTGFKKLDFDKILELRDNLGKSFESLKAEVEKIVEEDNQIAIHFTYHVKTIENPDEEMPLAHFMAIWELKDNKLLKGVQISQLGEEIDGSPWT
ncbi:nuclear transport factor 2 family protein [Salegentibacter sp. BLCTC]|uniref:Nuclear transport factor 2 family protein n=1 Tax=Salegentibacter maritimus TaxID=2794347 RepID=A0ABS0TG59_9FLAO|nr:MULTISPECIES: nuclear transport factor 2 family protein [Salegentibacter]MBE7639009.1 nuclear transport factor 2 family protein [Salegentibacter sp. BLCTC]MBI6119034.1 nuclear transport factor 2 family protein [Salegentibacter maritimus]